MEVTCVTCPYETSTQHVKQRLDEKQKKYEKLITSELAQAECSTGEVIPLVMGALGTIDERTNNNLKKLGVTKIKEALQMAVMKGSVNIINTHLQTKDNY